MKTALFCCVLRVVCPSPSGAFHALPDSEFYLLSTYVPNAASIYDVRTRGGRGSPKSRPKEQLQLICDSGGGRGVVKNP